MPDWLLWVLLASNALAFLAFGWDKLLARSGRRRVRERTLLWLTLAGCVGAWCGMLLLRHKTRKASFRWRAVAVTVLSLGLHWLVTATWDGGGSV
jgi:uncharacterized membrane protein YsdA (DUF1294 family)